MMRQTEPSESIAEGRPFWNARSITQFYPFLRGTRRVSQFLGALRSNTDRWAVTPDNEHLPTLALNLGIEFHRRLDLFPRAYKRLYMQSELIGLIARELDRGGVFLDIGCNVGIYSLIAAQRLRGIGQVYSFEPDPVSFESLQRSAHVNQLDNIQPVNVALSNENSRALLYRDAPGSTANSLIGHKDPQARRSLDSVSVRAIKLDDHYMEIGFEPSALRLVKVDVEGAEVQAVSGALGVLRAARPPIWCEVRGPAGSTRAPNTFTAVSQLLASLGYQALRRQGGIERAVSDVIGREDILFRFGV